jgi:hypothetical protein
MAKKKEKKLKAHNIAMMKVCQECGDLIHRKDTTFEEPFAAEIYNEHVPAILCPKCAWEGIKDC